MSKWTVTFYKENGFKKYSQHFVEAELEQEAIVKARKEAES